MEAIYHAGTLIDHNTRMDPLAKRLHKHASAKMRAAPQPTAGKFYRPRVLSAKKNFSTARTNPSARGKVCSSQTPHHSAIVLQPKRCVSGRPYNSGCWPSIVPTTEVNERGAPSRKIGSAKILRAGLLLRAESLRRGCIMGFCSSE